MPPTLIDARYEVLALVGEGAVGRVVRARDQVHGGLVAIKLPRTDVPYAADAVGREVRTRLELMHPNLVGVRRSGNDDGQPYVVMEWVDGAPVDAWLAEQSDRAAALRSVLRQVVDALRALHDAGCVHGDLKPSHVLIEPDGRAVIIDFDLTTRVDVIGADGDRARRLSGTRGFLAPERLYRNRPAHPGADVYALGALLWTLFDGAPPPLPDPVGRPPAPPRPTPALAALADLAIRCMAPDPAERPDLDAVRDAIAPGARPVRHAAGHLVGRATPASTLDRLDATPDAPPVLVHGPSGIGKTCLLRHHLDHAHRARPGRTWTARCHPDLTGPFRSLDGWIDGLAEAARRDPPPADVRAALASRFPRLAGDRPAPEPAALEDALAAFRALLAHHARTAPLRLWLDDVQWIEPDTAAFVRALAARTPPGVRLLMTARTASPPVDLPDHTVRLPLGPLDEDAVAQWARAVGHDPAALDLPGWRASTGGNPFLLALLLEARDPAHVLTHGPATAVASLRPAAREAFELLSLASDPLPRTALEALLGERADPALQELAHRRLVRLEAQDADASWAPAHDRLRVAAAAAIPAPTRAARHLALGEHWLTGVPQVPSRIAFHLDAAGDPRTARWAAEAAAEAEVRVAWDAAARWHAVAQRHGDDTLARARALATAQTLAGVAEAPATWTALAGRLVGDDAVRARVEAACILIGRGDLDAGFATLGPALRSTGLSVPRSTPGIVAALLAAEVRGSRWIARRRPHRTPTRAEALRLDVAWAVTGALGIIDARQSAAVIASHAIEAFDHGTPVHRVRALAVHGAFRLANDGGGAFGRWVVDEGRRRLDSPDTDRDDRALLCWGHGYGAFISGDLVRARHLLGCALAAWDARAFRGWERDHALAHIAWCDRFGHLGSAQSDGPDRALDTFRASANRYQVAQMEVGPAAWRALCAGDLAVARAALARHGTPDTPWGTRFLADHLAVHVALYDADVRATQRALDALRRRSRTLIGAIHRLTDDAVHASLLEAHAAADARRAPAVAPLRRRVRRLLASGRPWPAAAGRALEAWAAWLDGDRAHAATAWRDARDRHVEIGWYGHAAACALYSANASDDQEAARAARADLADRGIVDIGRWLGTTLPGPAEEGRWGTSTG